MSASRKANAKAQAKATGDEIADALGDLPLSELNVFLAGFELWKKEKVKARIRTVAMNGATTLGKGHPTRKAIVSLIRKRLTGQRALTVRRIISAVIKTFEVEVEGDVDDEGEEEEREEEEEEEQEDEEEEVESKKELEVKEDRPKDKKKEDKKEKTAAGKGGGRVAPQAAPAGKRKAGAKARTG